MAFVPKTDVEWLKEHANPEKDDYWVCKTTGKPIHQIETGRSIHTSGFSGPDDVKWVMHLYCTGCNPDFKPPKGGAPIQKDDLVEVD